MICLTVLAIFDTVYQIIFKAMPAFINTALLVKTLFIVL